jgi:hypothetical protein
VWGLIVELLAAEGICRRIRTACWQPEAVTTKQANEGDKRIYIIRTVVDPQVQIWMPVILALFGSLIGVVLRPAEMRQGFAELELTRQILELDRRVERLVSSAA